MQRALPIACFALAFSDAILVALVPSTLPLAFQLHLCVRAATWSLSALRGVWLLGEDVQTASRAIPAATIDVLEEEEPVLRVRSALRAGAGCSEEDCCKCFVDLSAGETLRAAP